MDFSNPNTPEILSRKGCTKIDCLLPTWHTYVCMREGMKQIRHDDLCFESICLFLSLQEILDDDFWRNKYYVWKRRTKMPMTVALFFSISIQIICQIVRFHAIWHPQGLGPKRLVPSGGIFFVYISILDRLRNSSNSHWWILSVCPLSYLNILCFQILFGLHWDSPIDSLPLSL